MADRFQPQRLLAQPPGLGQRPVGRMQGRRLGQLLQQVHDAGEQSLHQWLRIIVP
jgi:hypothetical protein